MESEKKPIYAFETETVKETLSRLNVDQKTGLSQEEVNRRIKEFGENKLKEKKKDSWIKVFFGQMNDSMIFVLFAAILVTIIVSIYETIKAGYFDFLKVGDWPDVCIILLVILMNSMIGTIQEIKAQASLDALKKMASPETLVIRDGIRMKIKSTNLVPGDIVILEEGDTVGADIRLIESYNLKANESSLTGESLPVDKEAEMVFTNPVGIGDRINLCYMTTPVVYGRGVGVVVATGMNTEIGKIASALDTEEQMTPLQKTLAKLSKFFGIVTLIITFAVLLVEIIWIFIDKNASNMDSWIDSLLSAIALAVAAIPEGLPAVVTIVLSIGVQRMVKANTIVRKLASVETLGAVSVICSDKTGTLTQNKMTVLEAYVPNKYYLREDFKKDSKEESLLLLARGMSLCSNASVDDGVYGDPTEIALVSMANEFGMHKKDLNNLFPRIDELPFDSVRKMMSTKHRVGDSKNIIFTKGALDSIISRATRILDSGKVRKIENEDIEALFKANEYFASKALRVLALAYDEKDKLEENDLILIGIVAMIDPARKEAKPAVDRLKSAGITTIMITGDHKDTAFAIAKELGIASIKEECMQGSELDLLAFDEIKEKIKTIRVFSRVSPENKVQIVSAFQSLGHICAMTGDGVNDAPSLRKADIGIAMGITGTDVSKEASDMVLADDNFASIEKAVEEGRSIYSNIKKTVIFLISSNIAEVITMFAIVILGLPSPLMAIHLLWVNLITDSLPAIALGMDKKDPKNMLDLPRDPNEGIFAKGGLRDTILYGAILSIGVIIAYFVPAWLNDTFSLSGIKYLYDSNELILHQAQTMAFTALGFGELFHMIGMSNVRAPFYKIVMNKNFMMAIAFLSGLILQLFVIEAPFMRNLFSTANLDKTEWIITALISVLPLLIHEFIVFIRFVAKKIKSKNA